MNTKELRNKLNDCGYYCGEELALILLLAKELKKPLLLEGPAGVGKTELARAYAAAEDCELIRLQCYEGLDEHHALYEWNYQKQLLYLESKKGCVWEETKENLFSDEFLLPRPLLKSFLSEKPSVLLIDEIDKSDEEFESFLLEALSDFAVTIPERGTVTAKNIPMVFLTSNAMRDFSDGLKRRCVHYYIDYPSEETEAQLLKSKLPQLSDTLAEEIAAFAARARKMKLNHLPGIAETLDWARALSVLGVRHLNEDKVKESMHFLVKCREDFQKVTEN